MAISIREQQPIVGAQAVALRPGRTSIQFEPSPIPLYDESGCFVGAVNLIHDCGQSGKPFSLWAEAARCHRLAGSILDDESVGDLQARAQDYEQNATAFESGRTPASSLELLTTIVRMRRLSV
jgi:hypothetical protein